MTKESTAGVVFIISFVAGIGYLGHRNLFSTTDNAHSHRVLSPQVTTGTCTYERPFDFLPHDRTHFFTLKSERELGVLGESLGFAYVAFDNRAFNAVNFVDDFVFGAVSELSTGKRGRLSISEAYDSGNVITVAVVHTERDATVHHPLLSQRDRCVYSFAVIKRDDIDPRARRIRFYDEESGESIGHLDIKLTRT